MTRKDYNKIAKASKDNYPRKEINLFMLATLPDTD